MKRITFISILLALLLVVPALATEASPTYTWDNVTFELTSITEDLGDWGSQLVSPEGKWVMVVLTITDGEIEISALEDRIIDNSAITLDGAAAKTLTAQGVRISEEMKALAVGTINVFFDMFADLDISQAAVNIVE